MPTPPVALRQCIESKWVMSASDSSLPRSYSGCSTTWNSKGDFVTIAKNLSLSSQFSLRYAEVRKIGVPSIHGKRNQLMHDSETKELLMRPVNDCSQTKYVSCWDWSYLDYRKLCESNFALHGGRSTMDGVQQIRIWHYRATLGEPHSGRNDCCCSCTDMLAGKSQAGLSVDWNEYA